MRTRPRFAKPSRTTITESWPSLTAEMKTVESGPNHDDFAQTCEAEVLVDALGRLHGHRGHRGDGQDVRLCREGRRDGQSTLVRNRDAPHAIDAFLGDCEEGLEPFLREPGAIPVVRFLDRGLRVREVLLGLVVGGAD